MKKFSIGLAMLLVAFAVIGCDHSTNNQPAPSGGGLTITAPTHQSFVDGEVTITVSTTGIAADLVEFYIDGNLWVRRSSKPWECSWNTSSLPSNSYHTIKAVAYTKYNSYASSQDVVVRIK